MSLCKIVESLTKALFFRFDRSSTLRRRVTPQSTEEQDSMVECIPLLRLTQYERGGSGSYLPHSEWNCQLLRNTPAAMGMSGRIVKLEDIYNLPEGTVQQFQSGSSVLKIPAAHVTSEEIITIPQGSAATIEANKTDTNDDVAIVSANVRKEDSRSKSQDFGFDHNIKCQEAQRFGLWHRRR